MKKTPEWSSQYIFIFAAAGAAVGLGNIWKFPYIAGENGGGAFVLIYLACILFIGIPLLMAELMIGRYGRSDPAASMELIAANEKKSRAWGLVGLLCILSSFLILSYYTVIAGWVLDYFYKALLNHITFLHASQASGAFKRLMANPWRMLFWQSVIMFVTIAIVIRGIKKGLERAVMFMFPLMVVLIGVVIIYATTTGGFYKAIVFLFHPNFAKLSTHSILEALGHAFFSLSLAVGTMIMYGAYVPKKISLLKSSVIIAATDTIIALLAGLAIFPIVFASGLKPDSGPGLIFQSLPLAFSKMPGGIFIEDIFFLALVFAALTSTISLLEPSVVWLMRRFSFSRTKAALISGIACWILGIATILSFNDWKGVKILGLSIFDFIDQLTANFFLPVSGLLVAVFVSWVLSKKTTQAQLAMNNASIYNTWHFSLRYIAPLAIIIILLTMCF